MLPAHSAVYRSPSGPQTLTISHDSIRRCRSPSPGGASTTAGTMDQLAVKPLRRTRSARSASPAIHRGVNISVEGAALLRKSWQRMPKGPFGDALIHDLVARIGKDSFGVDCMAVERHGRHFVELIQSAIDNLSDIEEALKPWLNLIGSGHNGFRIKSKHWDSFGEALVSTASAYIGPGRAHKETTRSWMLLSTFLADRLSVASRSAFHSPMVTPRLQLMSFVQP